MIYTTRKPQTENTGDQFACLLFRTFLTLIGAAAVGILIDACIRNFL